MLFVNETNNQNKVCKFIKVKKKDNIEKKYSRLDNRNLKLFNQFYK